LTGENLLFVLELAEAKAVVTGLVSLSRCEDFEKKIASPMAVVLCMKLDQNL
jgi:hypothetical protein